VEDQRGKEANMNRVLRSKRKRESVGSWSRHPDL